jgi:two-component system, NarL family, response regulator NreC
MIPILIIDDHELYVEGLSLILGKQSGIEVVGTIKSGKALLEQLPTTRAELLLLDIYLPDVEPEELIEQIIDIRPDLKIIYLTMMRGTRLVHKLIKYDVKGYVLKNALIEELVQAIRTVHAGGDFFSKEIDTRETLDDFRQSINVNDTRLTDLLTRREIQILELICKEYSNMEIAEKLFLSINTIETHRKKLIYKLGVNNTVGLVKFALKNKIIE